MNVFTNQIGFDINPITNPAALQISVAQGKWDDRHRKTVAPAIINRKANAIHGNRALRNQKPSQSRRHTEIEYRELALRSDRRDPAHAIDMARDQMTAEPFLQAHRLFEIDQAAHGKLCQVSTRQRFRRNIDRERTHEFFDYRQTSAVHRDAGTERHRTHR